MNLSYEYNEYVIGYVVTDIDTGRECNFQFDHDRNVSYSPVGQTHFVASACEGDDTHGDFNDDELEEMGEWLRGHADVRDAERAVTAAHETYELDESYGEMCAKAENGVFLSDIKALKTYKIADMLNGAFGEEYATLEAAEAALAEAIAEGTAINKENGMENAAAKAKSFYCIVDAVTGEEI